ncbi:MAG: hypothetical protein ACLQUY_11800 [Ktedonobacterales bacterium]
MHHHFQWGPGGYGGPPPGAYPPLAQVLLYGLANLFWIGLLAAVIWATVQAGRMPDRRALKSSAEDLSALELLRRSYVLGQIDVDTFSEMVMPLLETEEFEHYHKLSPPTPL